MNNVIKERESGIRRPEREQSNRANLLRSTFRSAKRAAFIAGVVAYMVVQQACMIPPQQTPNQYGWVPTGTQPPIPLNNNPYPSPPATAACSPETLEALADLKRTQGSGVTANWSNNSCYPQQQSSGYQYDYIGNTLNNSASSLIGGVTGALTGAATSALFNALNRH